MKQKGEPYVTISRKHVHAESLDGIKARTWIDDLYAGLLSLPWHRWWQQESRQYAKIYTRVSRVDFTSTFSVRSNKMAKFVRIWSRVRKVPRLFFWMVNKQNVKVNDPVLLASDRTHRSDTMVRSSKQRKDIDTASCREKCIFNVPRRSSVNESSGHCRLPFVGSMQQVMLFSA